MNTLDPSGNLYDIDLRSSGSGWTGTFSDVIRHTVGDILDEHESWSPTEVTLTDGTVLVGTLDVWVDDDDTFTITEPDELPRIVEIDDVVRFRA